MLMQRMSSGKTGKAFKLILLGVLVAAVAGLVLMDIGGFFRSGGVSRMDVARVGDKTIGIAEFTERYRRNLQQLRLNDDIAREMGLPYMMLQQDIGREVAVQAAQRSGVRIPLHTVATQLNAQLETLKIPGTNKEKLQVILQQQGLTERQFVEALRGDFAINMLMGAITPASAAVPPDLIRAFYNAQNEKRSAELVTITPANLKDSPAVSDDALKAYFAENKEHYRVPETRDLAFVTFPKNLYTPDVSVGNAEIEAYYNDHKNQFLTPARVRLAQIIAPGEETAKKIAADKPASFDSYKGDGVQAVASDWYAQTGLPKELADALFTEKPTGIVGPIKTDLGWHVLKVEQYEDSKPQDLAKVRDIISRQLKDEKLDAAMNAFSERIDQMIVSGESLSDIAAEYKLSPKTVSDVTPDNAIQKIKAFGLPMPVVNRLRESVAALDEDDISPLIDTPDGDFLLAQVTNREPSVIPELSTIKEKVSADARQQAEAKAMIDLAESVIGKYDIKNPASFTRAVQNEGLVSRPVAPMSREDADRTFSPEIGNMIFTLSPGNDLSYVTSDDSVTLIRLKGVERPNAQPDETAHAALTQTMQKQIGQEIENQFIAAWQDRLGVSINHDLIRKQFLEARQQ